jgi:hypothetical protein
MIEALKTLAMQVGFFAALFGAVKMLTMLH